jgi:hypothetical protein
MEGKTEEARECRTRLPASLSCPDGLQLRRRLPQFSDVNTNTIYFINVTFIYKYTNLEYYHVFGICVTNKTGFGFHDRIYWTSIQLVTTVHKSLSDTLSPSSGWVLHGNYSYFQLDCQSKSYVRTDGHLTSLSWNKAPIWGLRPDFYYCQLWVCSCGALSLTRGQVWRFQLQLVLVSEVFLGSGSSGTRDHILLSQLVVITPLPEFS